MSSEFVKRKVDFEKFDQIILCSIGIKYFYRRNFTIKGGEICANWVNELKWLECSISYEGGQRVGKKCEGRVF